MDSTPTQDQAGPSNSRGKTIAQPGSLRRSGRVATRTQKAQDAINQDLAASAGANQGHDKTPNAKGAPKVNKKDAAKPKSDSSTSSKNQAPFNKKGKTSTQANTTQTPATASASQYSMNPRTEMTANTLRSESSDSSSEDGEEVNDPSPPSPSPFYDPRRAGQAQRSGHGGTGYQQGPTPTQPSSARGRRVSRDVSGDSDAMDITNDESQHHAGGNDAASMAGPCALGGGNAAAAAASGFQAPRPQSPPPVLYDYQTEYVAKALTAATKLKETMATIRKENPPFSSSPYVGSSPPGFGPVPPPGKNQAANVRSGPRVSTQATKKKPETIHDIRRNMAKLLDDGPLSDLDFMEQHYKDEDSKKRLREAMVPLRGIFSTDKPVFKEHTGAEFLAQRAESSAYTQGQGQQPPSYAYAAPKANGKSKPAAKKAKTAEDVAAKAVKDFDKANREYDDAFERNLRSMFD